MTGHPQGTPRGIFAKDYFYIGNTLLSANTTGLIISNGLRFSQKAAYITANSTGIKIGNKYISTNTTGN